MQKTQETWICFLGQEDSLEKEVATHSSILAWKIPWTEEPGGLQRVRHDWAHTRILNDSYQFKLETAMYQAFFYN